MGCSDEVSLTQKSLEKYPEIKPFFDASGEYLSGGTNIDVGGGVWMKFRPNGDINAKGFFDNINSIVVPLGWRANKISDEAWEYFRVITFDGYAPMIYHVDIRHSAKAVDVGWSREFESEGSPKEANSASE